MGAGGGNDQSGITKRGTQETKRGIQEGGEKVGGGSDPEEFARLVVQLNKLQARTGLTHPRSAAPDPPWSQKVKEAEAAAIREAVARRRDNLRWMERCGRLSMRCGIFHQ